MNEPYYNDYLLGLQATYNFNESSALNIQGLTWMDGLSAYGEQLKNGKTGPGGFEQFDAAKAPHPKYGLFGNYQFIAYYGKISVTKQAVLSLNLFGLAGVGYLNLGELNTIALNFGVGQNLFITKNFGLRADLRWVIFKGPNATTQRLTTVDKPSASSFGDRYYYNSQLGLSFIFIL
ncbi:MAG: outer membrane beta-barrel domain-containing protein [Calothrix sp. SM1_5_4]|nr:outer membrane beta-barrel domain-containing protein [Calothrix sp. SM1_5_4]